MPYPIAALIAAMSLACLQAQEPDRSTPRKAVEGFLNAARAGDYMLAGKFLDVPDAAETYARDMHAVLEIALPDAIRRAPETATGEVTLGNASWPGGSAPIKLAFDPAHGWRFSRETVAAAPKMLNVLGLPWFGAFLPLWMFTIRVLEMSLWQWLGMIVLVTLSFLAGMIGRWIVMAIARSIVGRTETKWDDEFVAALPGPVRAFLTLAIVRAFLPLLHLQPGPRETVDLAVRVLLIATFTWLAIRMITFVARLAEAFLLRGVTDENRVRAIRTQIALPRRVFQFGTVVVGIALVFMQFEVVRTVGVSMMASAGLAGLVVGLAAQRMIASVLAGIQIAITQPIRIGDVVVVENEWGWIEEIGITYVVVKVWDLRRLVLPVNYFLERPFQNWTKVAPDLLGTVFVYADYTVPVEEARQELKRIVEGSPRWDRRVQGIQVTNMTDRTVEIRALVSAKDGGMLWDLRCEVREKLLGWLQSRGVSCLPLQRVEVSSGRNDKVREIATNNE